MNLRLLYADALSALLKLLFLVKRSWAATRHWNEQELSDLGIRGDFLAQIARAFDNPVPEAVRQLVQAVNAWLDSEGETFHHDPDELMSWAFFTVDGKRAFEVWSGR